MKNLQYTELPSCLKSRQDWARFFELKRPEEPHIHQIEPTNHCPYSCIMCPRSKHMTRQKGFMDIPLYKKIIDEIAGYSPAIRKKEIELFHFGESLLHPEIESMVGYASEKGLKTVLSVNAPQLTPILAEKILHNKPSKIIVSLDGYDDPSYKAIRGRNADYQKAVRNIDALLEIKVATSSHSQIIVRMIRMHINKDHSEEFKTSWEQKGASVELRDFFPWNKADMAELGKVDKYPPFMPCPFPWQYMVIQWNGDVVPCCRDYNGINSIGNVNHSTLKSIWNSEKASLFRKQMASGDYDNSICEECMGIYYTPSLLSKIN